MFMTYLVSKIRAWRRYRRNVRELSSLSTRERDFSHWHEHGEQGCRFLRSTD
jgi:hypothetical protein